MGKEIIPAISKIALKTLSDLFFTAMQDFESEAISFSKQYAIKQCYEKLRDFIRNRTFSNFEINVLSADNDKNLITLLFNNYTLLDDSIDIAASTFIVNISPTFTTFQVYVLSKNSTDLTPVQI